MSPSFTYSSFRSFIQPIKQFIYPPTCFACDAPIESGESRVCPQCWSTIRSMEDDDQLPREMAQRLTGGATSPISHLISLYHFEKEGTLQSIIHQLKYSGITSLGVELGRRLGEKLRLMMHDHPIDGLIPVPLHPVKMRERGYNQSEYIARGIREVLGIPVHSSLLLRHKYTASQTQLNAVERRENVGDAFSLNKRYLIDLNGKTLLLVDDVITTGATIEACARVLTNHGSRQVIVSSVALAAHDLDQL